jgi:hypothetical protein
MTLDNTEKLLVDLLVTIKEWEAQTLTESPYWSREYLQPLAIWHQRAQERLDQLRERRIVEERVSKNPYRPGNPLFPGQHENIYIERATAKRELETRLLRGQDLPLLFLQGQRRIGKTSLLQFIGQVLGSRTKTVFVDVQGFSGQAILAIFTHIRDQAAKVLQLPPPSEPLPADWLGAWQALVDFLERGTAQQGYGLLILLDEYECLHELLKADPPAAAALLGGLRSLLQRQGQVGFLFAGAAFFSELHQPDWANYLVGAELFSLDYFNEQETLHLVTNPVKDKIFYAPGVPEEIFRLTQGHPDLIQRLCKALVRRANQENRPHLTADDLAHVLEHDIYRPTNGSVEVFWGEFCVPEADRSKSEVEKMNTPERQVVRWLLQGQGQPIPEELKPALQRLLNHRFVIRNAQGQYQLRVPIFAEWVRRFGGVFL